MTQLERKIRRSAGQAIHKYGMIQNGDRILVAVSGGKDSLTLLWYLQDHQKRAPIDYELVPVHLEMGYNPGGGERLESYFRETGLAHSVEFTDYGPRAHKEGNALNPCFICARLRRKRLFELAEDSGCNKIAFGHNRDDFVETLLINMFYSGQIASMKPMQPLFQGKICLIRPLAMAPAHNIQRFADALGLPCIENPCPSAHDSKRTEIRRMLADLAAKNDKIIANIFHSLQNVKQDYLL